MTKIQRGVMVEYDVWKEANEMGITPTMVIEKALKDAIQEKRKIQSKE